MGRASQALCSALVLAVLATGGAGCALFGKKDGSSDPHSRFAWFKKKDTSTNPPPPKFPDPIVAPPGTPPPTPPTPSAQNSTPTEALLAGSVVDAYKRRAANTAIQLVRLDDAKEPGAPLEVKTDADGYFLIPGLKSGGQYKLIARTKLGEKMIAGITLLQAPNVNVLIEMKEEFATSSIPPIPASNVTPAAQEKKEKPATTSGLNNKVPALASWAPTPPGGSPAPVASPTSTDIDLPTRLTVPAPIPTSAPNGGVAGTPNTPFPPTLQIGGPKKSSVPPAPPPAMPAPGELQTSLAPLVPSCVVVAGRIQILALKDVDDQTWNLFKDRKGRLILLDFWSRDCIHCQKAMPLLTELQNRFGPQGLEVVGVLIDSAAPKDQANYAKEQCFRLKTNYRQVLGQNEKTNLRGQFNVQAYPTLILVDDTGRVLLRHEGVPDPAMLEHVLQKHLEKKAF